MRRRQDPNRPATRTGPGRTAQHRPDADGLHNPDRTRTDRATQTERRRTAKPGPDPDGSRNADRTQTDCTTRTRPGRITQPRPDADGLQNPDPTRTNYTTHTQTDCTTRTGPGRLAQRRPDADGLKNPDRTRTESRIAFHDILAVSVSRQRVSMPRVTRFDRTRPGSDRRTNPVKAGRSRRHTPPYSLTRPTAPSPSAFHHSQACAPAPSPTAHPNRIAPYSP
jgi:hypothetical protein